MAGSAPDPVKLFGVRHHGPGCARALGAALAEYQPEIVLIEGPPEANDLLPLLGQEAFVPPAAILVHPADDASRAAFFPLADYSPELTAARWALTNNAEVEFIDLPMTHQFGLEDAETPEGDVRPDAEQDEVAEVDDEEAEPAEAESRKSHPIRSDPLGWLARAAGYDDRERWWEQQVEQRQNAAGLFDAIAEAMTELRTAAEEELSDEELSDAGGPQDGDPRESRDALREAYMRRRVRAAVKSGRHKIAVVCGAWHVPALASLGPDKPDRELLKGLPKVKTAATLCPWTNDRLTHASGYGAGIESPGWYGHLWKNAREPAIGWVTRAARLLRDEGQDASSAGVIEAVRLADALAALRGFCAPGLSELSQAILGVLCHGEPAPLALIRRKLEVGDALGSVPPDAPAVPLQKDLEATQKRLRFKPTGEKKPITLDLRKDTDLERSRLLHRLAILGVPWGVRGHESGTGTYKEGWTLHWRPEFAVRVIESNRYGGTVPAAASNKLTEHAGGSDGLADLVERLDAALLADLPDAVGLLVGRVRDAAAVAADAAGLAAAIPPLARVARYGDVRGTAAQDLLPVLRGMLERYFVGLPPACRALDDEAAAATLTGAEGVHAALKTLELTEEAETWRDALFALTNDDAVHGLLRGWAARTLLEERSIDADELARRARLALAAASEPAAAAAWVEGLLKGSAKVLLYEDAVWAALDGWLVTLDDERFLEVLPLLRRSFAHFSHPERREMGERVKRLDGAGGAGARSKTLAAGPPVDEERARRVIPVLKQILGTH